MATIRADETARAGATRAAVDAPRWLAPLSLGYLAVPNALFVAGWVHPAIAVASVAGLVVLVVRSVRRARADSVVGSGLPLSIWPLSAVLAVLGGAGGYVGQAWDWLKHNAILRDLVVEDWPVVYDVDGTPAGLVYYVAHYLPAAAVGKVFGWQAANAALAAWTALGVAIALWWFVVAVGRRNALVPVAFVAFSGLDVVGRVLVAPVLGLGDLVLPSGQLEWWSGVAMFPATVTSLVWGPQHALAGWVATGFALHEARRGRIGSALAAVTLVGLFSPFVVVGLVPLVVAAFWTAETRAALRSRAWSASVLLAGVATGPVLAYFAVIGADVEVPGDASITSAFVFVDPILDIGVARLLAAWLALVVVEVLVFAALARRSGAVRGDPVLSRVVPVATVTLVVLPLWRYGEWSDLAMRAAVPALFVLAVAVVRALFAAPRGSIARLAVVAVLVVGAVTPLTELHRAVTDSHQGADVVAANVDPDSAAETSGILELGRTQYATVPRFLVQYVGSTDTLFFERLAAD